MVNFKRDRFLLSVEMGRCELKDWILRFRPILRAKVDSKNVLLTFINGIL